jgi:hypothetical protein
MASSNHCPFFQKVKEIQKIKTDKDISFLESLQLQHKLCSSGLKKTDKPTRLTVQQTANRNNTR